MLSQTAEYALRAVVYLGEHEGAARTTRDIAEATQVPNGYLSKVLQALSRGGVVRSQRGLHGGFVLAGSPAEISLLDVIRVVDPFRRIRSCPLELPEHAHRLCPLHQQLDDAMGLIERSFGSTTIADLLADGQVLNPLHETTHVSRQCACGSNGKPTIDQPTDKKGTTDETSTTGAA